jgi:alkylation response protein AidB-like acyl-CoA dehydrogenase
VSGVREGLVASAARLFEGWERTDERGGWAEGLWGELEKAGLTLTSVPEGSGGTGGSLSEAVAVLRLVGRHAAPVPLAETDILAGWALSASGLPVPGGPLTAAPMRSDEGVVFRRVGAGWALSGRARCVPAARYAARLVVVGRREGGGTMVAAVDPGCCEISRGENLAGETRDDVTLDGVRVAGDEVAPAGGGVDEERLRLRGALTRSVLMAGALDRVLELSVSRAGERYQFGRPIGRFQAVQQQLATLAGEVAAAGAAADAAVAAAELGDATFEVAAAKVRTGEAAGKAAAIAHQVHGAIGFTERHPLHESTRRLWAWRDEFGAESEWAERLGSIIGGCGPENLWPILTAPPPALG